MSTYEIRSVGVIGAPRYVMRPFYTTAGTGLTWSDFSSQILLDLELVRVCCFVGSVSGTHVHVTGMTRHGSPSCSHNRTLHLYFISRNPTIPSHLTGIFRSFCPLHPISYKNFRLVSRKPSTADALGPNIFSNAHGKVIARTSCAAK